jgi:hypothetical protein
MFSRPTVAQALAFRGGNALHKLFLKRAGRYKGNPEAARNFASRFFGVPEEDVVAVGETYEPEVWDGKRFVPARTNRLAVLTGWNIASYETPPLEKAGLGGIFRLRGRVPGAWGFTAKMEFQF